MIEIRGAMRNLLFWCLMYLYSRFICLCRCSFGSWCICKAWYSLLQMLFSWPMYLQLAFLSLQILLSLPVMYNCIYILPFLGFEDTAFVNFASTSHIFDNVRMLPIEILHPQFALSITCRFRAEIVHPQFSKIHYRRYIRNACPAKFCSFVHQACDNVQTENK